MKLWTARILVVFVLVLLTAPQWVKAEVIEEYEVNLDYQPSGQYNTTQNRLDPNDETNRDTWDPVPTGVYVGGYTKESKLRLSDVPDSNYSVNLASVCRFDASQIMSGSSYFVVRLPMHTGQWTYAYMSIYEIDRTTNWTFERNLTYVSGNPHKLNDCKINFTRDPHYLVYWSKWISPSDVSPTDGNDHFTRSNRTYLIVNAPLYPDRFYLFVTTVKYASDKYVDVYLQPDSLTLNEWNRSTIATYNLIDPDTYNLEVTNVNISLGYSFDFRRGFGNSMCGYNKYMYEGDGLTFLVHIDEVHVDSYLTFMFPFATEIENASIEVEVAFVYYPTGGYSKFIDDTSEWNDFILLSSTNTIWTDLPAGWKDVPTHTTFWDGWLEIYLEFKNETRYRFFMRDMVSSNSTGYNASWSNTIFTWAYWIHETDNNWNPMEFFQYNHTNTEYETVHWQIQYSVQQNDYYWTQHTPAPNVVSYDKLEFDEMSWRNKLFYVTGAVLMFYGDRATFLHLPWGHYVSHTGMQFILIAEYAQLPGLIGLVSDGLNWAWDKLQDLGQWLYKIGQRIVGALSWFVERLVLWGSAILGLLIVALAFVIVFIPIFLSVKLGQIIVNLVRGNFNRAMEETKGLTSTVTGGRLGGR